MTCSWAACDKPAVAAIDGWAMCEACEVLHWSLEGTTSADMEIVVRWGHAQGHTDHAIGEALGVGGYRAGQIRESLGLTRNARRGSPGCGTASGARQHNRRGEPVCEECREAKNRPRRLSVDPVAVARACQGDRVALTAAERREVIRELHGRGRNDWQIADTTGIARQTVVRVRAELGLPGVERRAQAS